MNDPAEYPNIFEQTKDVLRDRRDGSEYDLTDAEIDNLDESFVWDFIGRAITELADAVREGRE